MMIMICTAAGICEISIYIFFLFIYLFDNVLMHPSAFDIYVDFLLGAIDLSINSYQKYFQLYILQLSYLMLRHTI